MIRDLVSAKRYLASAVIAVLTISTAITGSLPANASTPFSVVYNGNTIGTAVPATETQTRGVAFALPGSASVTGSRTGYSFGGWSTTAGGAAVANPYTYNGDASADNDRLDLYAVWNTTISYDKNGADSGALVGGKTNDTYRFGNTLTLPTVGTMVKSGFAFGGWMASSVATTRSTTYLAASSAVGNPTLYAAWIKTVNFNANGAATGTVPTSLVYVSGSDRLKLPVFSEMTLRKPGYDFVGWSTTSTGKVVSNPNSYVPLVANRTLYAIWKVQTTRSSTRVFFNVDKSFLRAAQKEILKDLVAELTGKTEIKVTMTATRNKGTGRALGRARNAAVVAYLESLGFEAVVVRNNVLGKSSVRTSPKNNRVTLVLSWKNAS